MSFHFLGNKRSKQGNFIKASIVKFIKEQFGEQLGDQSVVINFERPNNIFPRVWCKISHTNNLGDLVEISSFQLTQLPGCCAYLVSHDMKVNQAFRNKGLASFLQQVKHDMAAFAGFTQITATTLAKNVPENKILDRNSWKVVDEVTNRRTKNDLLMWIRGVSKEEAEQRLDEYKKNMDPLISKEEFDKVTARYEERRKRTRENEHIVNEGGDYLKELIAKIDDEEERYLRDMLPPNWDTEKWERVLT